MRKFVMPLLTAAFLAVAGTAAIPQSANAASVSVGIHGPGWDVHYSDRDRDRGHRYRGHRFRRHCEPIYRTQWHWTRHGWKRIKVQVGYDCGHRRHRRY